MRNFIYYGLPSLFTLCLLIILILAISTKPRVLVIMSYSTNNLWEKEIKTGLENEFKILNKNYDLNYFYLDTDEKIPQSKDRNGYIKMANDIVNSWHPQVLILVDDNAQRYVGVNYLDRPDIAIVFAGVNADPSVYHYAPHKNVTGVLERLAFPTAKRFIQEVFPNYKSVLHISDASFTSQFIIKKFSEFNWSPLVLTRSICSNSFAEWKKIIAQANKEQSIVLMTHYQNVRDTNELIPDKEIVNWVLKNAKVPVIGFFSFFIKQNGPIAITTQGGEEGEIVAQLTSRIINGHENPGNIPFQNTAFIGFGMNRNSMAVNIPDVKIPWVYQSLAYYSGNYV